MTTAETPLDRAGNTARRLLVAAVLVATIVLWPSEHAVAHPAVAMPLLVVVAAGALASLLPWRHLSQPVLASYIGVYALAAVLLYPLSNTVAAAVLPYAAMSVAGARLRSLPLAVAYAVAGSVLAAGGLWLVERQGSVRGWPWWVGLTIGLGVYAGITRRFREEALGSARTAADEARRAAAADARSAALEERGRIAREVHDVVGHSLSGIALQLELAEALQSRGRTDDALAAMRRARTLAVDSIGETRSAVHALRDGAKPVPEALRVVAEPYAATVTVDGDAEELAPVVGHTLVRVTQEALTNAARHAPGRPVGIRLAVSDDAVLTLVNELTGPPGEQGGTGMGLESMAERVALLGGSLRAGPVGGRWEVEVRIPR